MLTQYIQAAMDRAVYQMIEDEESFYGEIPGLDGVWATGMTLEACRRHLVEAVEDWLFFSLAKSLPIPSLGDLTIRAPERIAA